jgi:hypothetical protein
MKRLSNSKTTGQFDVVPFEDFLFHVLWLSRVVEWWGLILFLTSDSDGISFELWTQIRPLLDFTVFSA